LTLTAVLGAWVAPRLVERVVAPGFDPATAALTARLMRVMLISSVIFGLSGVIMGALNAHQHFLLPAIAPLTYNLAIIGGALFLAPSWGVMGLAVGVVLGLAFWAARGLLATLFSDDPAVVAELVLFLRIVSIAYAFGPINAYITLSLNAIGAPGRAAAISVGRLAVIIVPAAYIGATFGSASGLFLGMALGNIVAAGVSWALGRGPFLANGD